MEPKTLRVLARGTACVPDFERMEAGIRAFVGRRYVEVAPGSFGFTSTGAVAEVPARAEYAKALRDGDLWPADSETAKAVGVAFDPTFGGLVSPQEQDAHHFSQEA